MSLEELKERAQRLAATTRRTNALMWTALVLHILVHIAHGFVREEFEGWLVLLEFTTLTVLFLYWPYYWHERYGISNTGPLHVVPVAGAISGLAHYRKQLELEKDFIGDEYLGAGITGTLRVVAIGMWLVISLRNHPAVMIPWGIPFLVVALIYYVRRLRNLPNIQRELDELKAFMKESRA